MAAMNKKKGLTDSLKLEREVVVGLAHAVEEIPTTEHELETQRDSVSNTKKVSFEGTSGS